LVPLGQINGWTLAAGSDNRSVYVVHNTQGTDPGGQPRSTATISRMRFDARAQNFAVLTNHETLRIFSGRVTDMPFRQGPPATTPHPGSSGLTSPPAASHCSRIAFWAI
jgi:hypothetical protein